MQKNHLMETYTWTEKTDHMIGKSIFIFEDTDFESFVGSRCDLD